MNKTKKRRPSPTRGKETILEQLCKLIPTHITGKLAKKYEIETRKFSEWSHLVALLYAQLFHALSINDVCDSMRHHTGWLSRCRGATPPKRNTFAYANKTRDSRMFEDLFWEVKKHLEETQKWEAKKFGKHTKQRRFKGNLKRLKQVIHAVDSTTIQLIAANLDWATHRRKKAALKCHFRLDLQHFLPNCVAIGPGSESDIKRVRECCAQVIAGEMVTFDRGFCDYTFFIELTKRKIFWVTRTKTSLKFIVVESKNVKENSNILADELVKPADQNKEYSEAVFRRIRAKVIVDGKEQEMEFLTNDFKKSPETIAQIYQCRWQIEAFFKQIKQTLQIRTFLGNNENAIKCQIWTALLLYLLLRFCALREDWSHSFSRLFTLLRGLIWDKIDLRNVLAFYGTAAPPKLRAPPSKQLYLRGFAPNSIGQLDASNWAKTSF